MYLCSAIPQQTAEHIFLTYDLFYYCFLTLTTKLTEIPARQLQKEIYVKCCAEIYATSYIRFLL